MAFATAVAANFRLRTIGPEIYKLTVKTKQLIKILNSIILVALSKDTFPCQGFHYLFKMNVVWF